MKIGKEEAPNPIDELARASEALRRAKERHADSCKTVETADMIAQKARDARDEDWKNVERIRAQVKALAMKIADA